jgi:NAD(P)-dependent dehydrogenase (short-subunit alcohol dehydrogenase family)
MPHAVIAGITSCIGLAIAEHLLDEGWSVTGTSRRALPESLARKGVGLVACDFQSAASIDEAAQELLTSTPEWDALIVAPGTMNPIGDFTDVDIDEWGRSLDINFIHQLRLVHRLLGHANTRSSTTPTGVFFAGGGTNSAPVAFSSYVLSKVALIKAAELLDAEISDIAFTSVGPGWVRTTIHQETLDADRAPAGVVEETRRRLEADDFVDMKDVVSTIDWLLAQPKDVVGGRNFSVAGDPFAEPGFGDFLSADPSLLKLRRWGNDAYWSRHDF